MCSSLLGCRHVAALLSAAALARHKLCLINCHVHPNILFVHFVTFDRSGLMLRGTHPANSCKALMAVATQQLHMKNSAEWC